MILQVFTTNLRNRPLNSWDTKILCRTMCSLYYDLCTGSRVYPNINIKAVCRAALFRAPFGRTGMLENSDSALLQESAGVMVPPPDSDPPPPTIQSAVHPERLDLYSLRVNTDNNISVVTLSDRRVTRVISAVYSSDGTVLVNRWKVSTYDEDGHCLMSVLCKFLGQAAVHARTPRGTKRRSPDDESSSQAPARKRLRL